MPPMPPSLRLRPKEEGPTWLQRLKRLDKKDLAALGVCLLMLGVLPAAQHMMSPTGKDNGSLEQGFAVPGGGGSGDEYEQGLGVTNRGGLVGDAGGEVITPLAGRDPTSFILGINGAGGGAGGGRGNGAGGLGGGGASPASLKDSLAQMMQRSLPEANKAAALPTPNSHLTTSLGSLMGSFGGGAASGAGMVGLKPPSAEILAAAHSVPSHPSQMTSYGAGPAPGYNGVAKRGLTDMVGDAERQKAAADAAAAKFNHVGAESSLSQAAQASQIGGGPLGGGGGGGIGAGGPSVNPTTSGKDSTGKSFGQSLAQQEAMAEFQKQLDWCWQKQKDMNGSIFGALLTGGSTMSSGKTGVDCSNIPDWVDSGWVKAVDKVINDEIGKAIGGLLSVPFKWAEKGTKKLGPSDDKDPGCVLYFMDGQPGLKMVAPFQDIPAEEKSKSKGDDADDGDQQYREYECVGDFLGDKKSSKDSGYTQVNHTSGCHETSDSCWDPVKTPPKAKGNNPEGSSSPASNGPTKPDAKSVPAPTGGDPQAMECYNRGLETDDADALIANNNAATGSQFQSGNAAIAQADQDIVSFATTLCGALFTRMQFLAGSHTPPLTLGVSAQKGTAACAQGLQKRIEAGSFDGELTMPKTQAALGQLAAADGGNSQPPSLSVNGIADYALKPPDAAASKSEAQARYQRYVSAGQSNAPASNTATACFNAKTAAKLDPACQVRAYDAPSLVAIKKACKP